MFATLARWFPPGLKGNTWCLKGKKIEKTRWKPKYTHRGLGLPIEEAIPIRRCLHAILTKHGPVTVHGFWDIVKDSNIPGLDGKSHLKLFIKFMIERKRIKKTCIHTGKTKTFTFTAIPWKRF